jgi:hypothetical protein
MVSAAELKDLLCKRPPLPAVLLLVAGCAVEQPTTTVAPGQVIPFHESRNMLLHWYDETYRTYYDMHGPVKTVTVFATQEADEAGEAAGDAPRRWQLHFTPRGRLTEKQDLTGGQALRVTYRYHGDGRRDNISIYSVAQTWRVTRYNYNPSKQLLNEERRDLANGEVLHVRHRRQATATGWFDMSLPVETVDVVSAQEFAGDGALLWSSKGGFNNGPDLHYRIKTTDEVFSSRLVKGADGVKKIGGYGYEHYDSGRLKSVTSYGANDGGVYHTTQYHYDNKGLLRTENRQVTGKSLFNSAANEQVEYHYEETDVYGNWLQRRIEHHTRWGVKHYRQQRQIDYY